VPTSRLAPLPADVGIEQAAALPLAGLTALRTLRLAGDLLGRRVLVTGANGGVGRIQIQLAAAAGAQVTAVARAEHEKELLALGASSVVADPAAAVGLYCSSGAAILFAWRDYMPTFTEASLIAAGTGALLWVVLAVAFFILAAVCEGATVRAAAEHDAERPFGLGWAWRSGVATMWVIIRFRLLLLALILPVVLILAGLVFGAVASIANNSGGASVGFVLLGILLGLAAIPYFIYLFFLDRFGSRAVILEQLGARAAIVRAHRLLFKRLGRALLVWLLAVAVSIVVGILFACVAALIAVPFALIGVALFASGSAAVVPLIVVGVLILLPIVLIVQGFLTAQGSTYWTLAFRRIELEPPTPSYYQPVQPAPPPPPQVTS